MASMDYAAKLFNLGDSVELKMMIDSEDDYLQLRATLDDLKVTDKLPGHQFDSLVDPVAPQVRSWYKNRTGQVDPHPPTSQAIETTVALHKGRHDEPAPNNGGNKASQVCEQIQPPCSKQTNHNQHLPGAEGRTPQASMHRNERCQRSNPKQVTQEEKGHPDQGSRHQDPPGWRIFRNQGEHNAQKEHVTAETITGAFAPPRRTFWT